MKRIRYGIAIAAAGLLFASLCLSQSRRSARRPAAEPRAPFLLESVSYEEASPGTRVVFKNGMTVLVHETRAARLISARAYVSRGASGPLAEDDGVAELIGALVCRGGGRAAREPSVSGFRRLEEFLTTAPPPGTTSLKS